MKQFVVMGVTSCGKSTIAEGLAKRIDAVHIEADALHGEANISKMASGKPLTDDDRWPWLERVASAIQEQQASVVVSCSALKRAYRDVLRSEGNSSITFVHLHAHRDILAERMVKRVGHFMPTSLLDSQLDILEPLESDEEGFVINIDQSIESIIDEAVLRINAD